ncbi:MAG: hypothetical protein MUE97_06165 [Phycisphaerales bacterium]|jgi:DNA modification methylase|nr:hypothetical protein [Phycisphaerales bacterium]
MASRPFGSSRPPRPTGSAGSSASRRPAARFDKPPLSVFTTTLWDYPSQHYNSTTSGREIGRDALSDEAHEGSGPRDVRTMQGDSRYVGATPSWVIWQCLQRYTRKGETVIDPMCGSGTTLDVCTDLGRVGLGFDLASHSRRSDIRQADARKLPVKAETCDFAFIDPPYSTHVDYSDDPRCIGKLDAGGEDRGEAYYSAMDRVLSELHRVLKRDRYMAIYVSDSFRKTRSGKPLFMPIGFSLWHLMMERFEPVDIIAVVRYNHKLDKPNWHKAAIAENFYLRGFNYLLLGRKA